MPTREGLSALALMRRQELDRFIEGFFGGEEALDLPDRAHRALSDLAEMRTRFAAVVEAAKDDRTAGTAKERETTLSHIRTMTRVAEHEMHAIVLSCVRARRQILARLPARKPNLH